MLVVAGSAIRSYRSKSYSASRKRASAAAAAARGLWSGFSPRFANSATAAWKLALAAFSSPERAVGERDLEVRLDDELVLLRLREPLHELLERLDLPLAVAHLLVDERGVELGAGGVLRVRVEARVARERGRGAVVPLEVLERAGRVVERVLAVLRARGSSRRARGSARPPCRSRRCSRRCSRRGRAPRPRARRAGTRSRAARRGAARSRTGGRSRSSSPRCRAPCRRTRAAAPPRRARGRASPRPPTPSRP